MVVEKDIFAELKETFSLVKELEQQVASVPKLKTAINQLADRISNVISSVSSLQSEFTSLSQDVKKVDINAVWEIGQRFSDIEAEFNRVKSLVKRVDPQLEDKLNQIGAFISKAQSQIHQRNQDTALGVQERDLNMGGHKILNVEGSQVVTEESLKERLGRIAPLIGGGGSGISRSGIWAENDYVRVTSGGALQGRSISEARTDLFLEYYIDSVDDFQDAIDELAANGGGKIKLGSIDYEIEVPLVLPDIGSGVFINIDGCGLSTRLIICADMDGIFTTSGMDSWAGTISNMLLYGDSSNYTGSGFYGRTASGGRALFDHVYFHYFKENGIALIKGGGGVDFVTRILYSTFNHCGHSGSATSGGVYSSSAGHVRLFGNHFTGESYQHVYASAATALWLDHNFFGDMAQNGYGVHLVGGGNYISVLNNLFDQGVNSGHNPIRINATGNFGVVAVRGNTIAPTQADSNVFLDITGTSHIYELDITENTFRLGSGLTADSMIKITATNWDSGSILGNDFANRGTLTNGVINGTVPSTVLVDNNPGYIHSGEIREASGSLTAGNVNAFAFAWQNPEGQAITILELMVDVTTAGGTAGSVLDAGSAAGATTHNDDLLDGEDLNATNIYVSTERVKLDANGGTTDYITGQILTQNAASLAGKYYIKYMGT